jgi:hypothetical protein
MKVHYRRGVSETVTTLPKELLHIILELDGRIKYRNGKYVNVIHKYDERYDMIKQLILKKIEIVKTINIDGTTFYFEFRFDACRNRGLCYDVGFNAVNRFEICYVDLRDGWKQVRTYL